MKQSSAEAARILPIDAYWNTWHGQADWNGVSVHLRRETFPQEPTAFILPFRNESRYVEVTVGDLAFASFYVPSGASGPSRHGVKLEFLRVMADRVKALADRRIVLCGDLNVAREDADVHYLRPSPTQSGRRPDERALVRKILDAGVVDVGARGPLGETGKRAFSWWSSSRGCRGGNKGWRLDYVLASAALVGEATRCDVLGEFVTTDHAPVLATLG